MSSTDEWSAVFTGTRSNVAKIRKALGRMENMDGDVSTSLLYKARNEPYRVWSEISHSWIEVHPGYVIRVLGRVHVPKYGFLPNVQVDAPELGLEDSRNG